MTYAWTIGSFCGLVLLVLENSVLRLDTQTAAQQEPPKAPPTYTLECYYRAMWGHADEFLQLFRKNHLPVLQALQEKGRIQQISIVKPRYHGTEDGRWDYRVTIVFRNAEVALDPSVEEALKKELFPDQETFQKEESRRFEILAAHWDIPVQSVSVEE
jgi:hypothetical protein